MGSDTVSHLAASADARFGPDHPGRDLEQNTIGTFNVLEAMRKNGISRIAFSLYRLGARCISRDPDTGGLPVQTSWQERPHDRLPKRR